MYIFSNNTKEQLSEGLLRFAMGFFLLAAGASKFVSGYGAFVTEASGGFGGTFLPMGLVTFFLYLIPVLELVFGLLLLTGWQRDKVLYMSGKLFILLMLGLLISGDMASIPNLFIYLFVTCYTLTLPSMKMGK